MMSKVDQGINGIANISDDTISDDEQDMVTRVRLGAWVGSGNLKTLSDRWSKVSWT